jgi:hypothetical protein
MVVKGLVGGILVGMATFGAAVWALGVTGSDGSAQASAPAAAVPGHAAPAVERPLPAGFRRRTVPETRLSLGVPRRWQALTRGDATYPGTIQMLAGIDRALRLPLVGLTVPDSPLKLFGFDLRAGAGGAATFSVLVDGGPPPGPFERWSVRVRRELGRLPDLSGPVTAQRVTLPAGEALLAEYRRTVPGPGASVVSTTHYVVAAGDQLVALVFAAPEQQLAAYRSTFRAAARTLALR